MVSSANVPQMSFGNKLKMGNLVGANTIYASTKSNDILHKNNLPEYEVIDYNKLPETSIQAVDEDDKFISLKKDTFNAEFVNKKIWNSAIWQGTKNIVRDAIEASGGDTTSEFAILTLALVEGGHKSVLEAISSGENIKVSTYAAGFIKSFSSSYIKDYVKYTRFSDFLKTNTLKKLSSELEKKLGEGAYKKLVDQYGSDAILKKTNPELWKSISLGNFTNVVGSMGLGIGIDYLSSMAVNLYKALDNGEYINFHTLKGGSTLLKSSTKLICATAGQLIGGKSGKVIGTVIGATIGEFQVAMFNDETRDNEKWCAIAGGAQIAGAVAGAALIAFCVSNPAGWVMGVAILAGAAIGFTITLIAYHGAEVLDIVVDAVASVGEWSVGIIKSAVTGIYDASEWVINKAEVACEYISKKMESAVNFVEEKIELVENFVEDKIDKLENFVEDKIDKLEKLTKANSVTNFVLGWAF